MLNYLTYKKKTFISVFCSHLLKHKRLMTFLIMAFLLFFFYLWLSTVFVNVHLCYHNYNFNNILKQTLNIKSNFSSAINIS